MVGSRGQHRFRDTVIPSTQVFRPLRQGSGPWYVCCLLSHISFTQQLRVVHIPLFSLTYSLFPSTTTPACVLPSQYQIIIPINAHQYHQSPPTSVGELWLLEAGDTSTLHHLVVESLESQAIHAHHRVFLASPSHGEGVCNHSGIVSIQLKAGEHSKDGTGLKIVGVVSQSDIVKLLWDARDELTEALAKTLEDVDLQEVRKRGGEEVLGAREGCCGYGWTVFCVLVCTVSVCGCSSTNTTNNSNNNNYNVITTTSTQGPVYTVPATTSTLHAFGFMARDHLSAIAVVDRYVRVCVFVSVCL